MIMQQHLLAGLREELHQWEQLLAGLSEEQVTTPQFAEGWSIKDVIVHLWGWQQRSIARVEAALHDHEPLFPEWPIATDPDGPGEPHQLNAWIRSMHQDTPWPAVYRMWREGFQRFLELAGGISERDLLDGGRYPWMEDRPLAFVLLASYDHHHEHFEGVAGGEGGI